jgi:hypothetical protein
MFSYINQQKVAFHLTLDRDMSNTTNALFVVVNVTDKVRYFK